MCGIVGILGKENIVSQLMEGLKRLEYRGYDSAGIAILEKGEIKRCRSVGKIVELEKALKSQPLRGTSGIGHTRWATHGVPNEKNAHPHATDKVVLVHNGIIENFLELRQELEKQGHKFQSDTDTEVIVHLISHFLDEGNDPQKAASLALKRLHGAFAIAMLFAHEENLLICARRGSPLAVGFGDGEMFVGSDALALAPFTQTICYLEEGDLGVVRRGSLQVYDALGHLVERTSKKTALTGEIMEKGEYPHYMLKEIFEQPGVMGDILQAYFNPAKQEVSLALSNVDWKDVSLISIVACGTSFYAAMVAKNWIERIAKINVQVDIGSEFRYRKPPLPKGGVVLVISQSGETADTLGALRYAKEVGQKIISIVNVPESSIARESHAFLELHAGPEIGVASTKAFTAQLMVLACLTLLMARCRKTITTEEEFKLIQVLLEVPSQMGKVLAEAGKIQKMAEQIRDSHSVLYLGRGPQYAIALEGALKLKELSYIHAEGFASGELKHGPIALIDEKTPLVYLIPHDDLYEKNISNLEEVISRKGRVLLFADEDFIGRFKKKIESAFPMPSVQSFAVPLVYAIPMQLLAYYTAVSKRTDVDQPRNLAKSVTVE
jgi:glucosamine--fructose-6-phosphate aminotransferase (isomerizing)